MFIERNYLVQAASSEVTRGGLKRQARVRRPWERSLLLDFVLWVIGMMVEIFPAQGEQKVENSGHREWESDLKGTQLGLHRRQKEELCWMVWRAWTLKGKPCEWIWTWSLGQRGWNGSSIINYLFYADPHSSYLGSGQKGIGPEKGRKTSREDGAQVLVSRDGGLAEGGELGHI